MPRSGASSSGLTVTVDLSSVLLSTSARRRALPLQCITIPAGLNDLRAFEALLRAQPYGSYLISEELTYLRSTDGGIAEVKDSTFSFRGATVLTVVPADPAYRDADMLCLPCGVMPPQPADILPAIDTGLQLLPRQSGASDSRTPLQQRASAAASAARAAGTAASADSAERGGSSSSTGDAAGSSLPTAPTWAAFLRAVQSEKVLQGTESRLSTGLPGILLGEDGRVMPAAAGIFDRLVHGERRTCEHCGVLQWKNMFHPMVWDRKNQRTCVCLDCEARLKCSCCDRYLSHRAFSVTQKRFKWNGTSCCRNAQGELECNCQRKCNGCIGDADVKKTAMAAARIMKRCGALQCILFFFWKRVWATAATEELLSKQDAMAGLDEAAETPAKDPEVTELELKESELAAADKRVQELLKAGGIPEGTNVELRSDACREGVAGKNKSPAGDICEFTLIEQSAVVAVDWEPGSPQILVASYDGDGGWLMTTDGEGVTGSVSISTCDAVVECYKPGWLGVVEASTAQDVKRGSVEVFHGSCDLEVEHPSGERTEVPATVGYLGTGRTVCIVEFDNDRVLVEDITDVDCDMVTDYDTYLEFDDERTPREFDDRGEEPGDYIVYEDASTATGSGCVIEMHARSARGLVEKNVRRSAVWLSALCLCKHSIHAQFGVDSTS